MPDILKLTPQYATWLYGKIRMFAFDGLDAGQFIHADGAFSLFRPFSCAGIHLTALPNFLLAPLIGHLRQPIAEAVGLQPTFLSK
jgi:hypothetical protein